MQRAAPALRVVRVGVGLALTPRSLGVATISCGLAGGLRSGMPTGTVLVPRSVGLPDGTVRECDEELSAALSAAARSLGAEPLDAPLLTSPTLIRGSRRAYWAAAGFAGVDMETGRLAAPRLAAVRVVLDTPERELSAAWVHPARVLITPSAWAELPWLAGAAPRCARLAAAIVARAFSPNTNGAER